MKKLIALLLALVMVFGLVACGSTEPVSTDTPASDAPAAETSEEEKLTVGLALAALNTNAVFIDMRKEIEARCEESGYKLMTADIEAGPAAIVTALENFINGGCDIIIVQNSAEEACADLLQQAVDKGIIVASYDYPSEICQYACVCANYDVGYAIGEQMGKFCAENEGSKKVAICSYTSLDFLVEREQGMRDGFAAACPEGEIVMAQDAGYASEGVTAGENFLQACPDIQGVMGINDGGIMGVYEAFKAAGKSFEKDGIALIGCDASVDGINAMKEGDMFYCTIDLDLINQVGEMYERCVTAALTGEIDAEKAIVTYPAVPLFQEDVQ